MSELTKRILFGVPAAALFLYLVWTGGLAFEIFIAGIAMMIVIEMVRLFQKMEHSAILIISFLLGLFLWTIIYQPFWMVLTMLSAVFLITVWSLISGNRTLSSCWLTTLFCGFYAPVGMFFFKEVRKMEPDLAGLWFAFALILMIWGNDIFAYFGGRSFGKRPLAPKISPNKTWEGFWSGFAGALLGLLIIYIIADPFPLGFSTTLPLVFLISIFGPAGDLLESRLKRLAGVKDSSNLLPGHGGFFDRFDALILSAPIAYLYLYMVY